MPNMPNMAAVRCQPPEAHMFACQRQLDCQWLLEERLPLLQLFLTLLLLVLLDWTPCQHLHTCLGQQHQA